MPNITSKISLKDSKLQDSRESSRENIQSFKTWNLILYFCMQIRMKYDLLIVYITRTYDDIVDIVLKRFPVS